MMKIRGRGNLSIKVAKIPISCSVPVPDVVVAICKIRGVLKPPEVVPG
jgi:hypothetical protein